MVCDEKGQRSDCRSETKVAENVPFALGSCPRVSSVFVGISEPVLCARESRDKFIVAGIDLSPYVVGVAPTLGTGLFVGARITVQLFEVPVRRVQFSALFVVTVECT